MNEWVSHSQGIHLKPGPFTSVNLPVLNSRASITIQLGQQHPILQSPFHLLFH